jgi:hypothetical protein
MTRHFSVAPWPRALKVSSLLGGTLVVGIGVMTYRAIPVRSGFTHLFGLGMALVLPALLIGSLLFVVQGYVLESDALRVQRLLHSTRIPLEDVHSVRADPTICKGSIRIIGNAGLFSFTGLYRREGIGRFRLYATDLSKSVILETADRVVVVTPASPEAFVSHVHRLFPGTGASPG